MLRHVRDTSFQQVQTTVERRHLCRQVSTLQCSLNHLDNRLNNWRILWNTQTQTAPHRLMRNRMKSRWHATWHPISTIPPLHHIFVNHCHNCHCIIFHHQLSWHHICLHQCRLSTSVLDLQSKCNISHIILLTSSGKPDTELLDIQPSLRSHFKLSSLDLLQVCRWLIVSKLFLLTVTEYFWWL